MVIIVAHVGAMIDRIRWWPMSIPISAGATIVILVSGAATKFFWDSGLAQWWGGVDKKVYRGLEVDYGSGPVVGRQGPLGSKR
jgi:hypothetical protein